VPIQATATSPEGDDVSDGTVANYQGTTPGTPGDEAPEITLGEPTVNGEPAGDAPGPQVPEGEQAEIAVPVTNTGDTDVENLEGSSPTGDLTCESTELAPGEDTTCTITTTPSTGDQSLPIEVTAENPEGGTTSEAVVVEFQGETPGTPGDDQPEITVSNPTVNGEDAATQPGPEVTPGDDAQVEATVTNTGDTELSDLQASAPEGDLTCESTDLAPGESTTCSISEQSTDGEQTVPIQATATSPEGDDVSDGTVANYQGTTPGTPGDEAPEITLGEPTVNGEPAGDAPGPQVPEGEQAEIAVPVTNTGDTDVENLEGSSPTGDLTCESTELAPGEDTTCTITTTPSTGDQSLPIEVTAENPEGGTTSEAVVVEFQGETPGTPGDDQPEITVSNPTVNGEDAATQPGPEVTPGDDAQVEATVTNTGDTELSDLQASAPEGDLTCESTDLAPGESTTCSISEQSTDGEQTVPIQATATSPEGDDVSDGTVANYQGTTPGTPGDEAPEITVSNPTVNGEDAATQPGPEVTPGDDAQVEATVTNTGDTDLENLEGSSTDGDVTCESTDLAPGESTTCSTTLEAAEGEQSTPIEVTAATPDGDEVSDDIVANYQGTTPGTPGDDDAEITVTNPTINDESAANEPGPQVAPGDQAEIQATVTNTGDTDVEDLQGSAGDDALTCESTDLAPGESTTCSATVDAQSGDQSLPLEVTAADSDGDDVSDTTTANYQGEQPGSGTTEVTIGEPTVNGRPAGSGSGPAVTKGQPATVAVPITNTGDTTVEDVSGSTPDGELTCTDTSLAPGESTVCRGTIVAESGSQELPVTVVATDPQDGTEASATRVARYEGRTAAPAGADGENGEGDGNGHGTDADNEGVPTSGGISADTNDPGNTQPGQVTDVPVGSVPAGSTSNSASGDGWLFGAGLLMLVLSFVVAPLRRRRKVGIDALLNKSEMEIS